MASGITLPLCFEEIPEMMKDIWLKLDKSRYKIFPDSYESGIDHYSGSLQTFTHSMALE